MAIRQVGATEGEITPRGERVVTVDEAAEAFVEILNANEVDYIFLNPGTDTSPVQEALAKFKALGKRAPKVILSLHEHMAMAAAHGYFMISGRPQVVMVHVDLGTQNVGGALHNAWRGRAGVIFCAGRTPVTFEGELRGGRNSYVQWIQEHFDQAGIVRGYVKWDYELRRVENLNHAVQRAFQIACTEPYGPVYLTLPREVMMERMERVKVLPRERYGPVPSPQADSQSLQRAAQLLVRSNYPIILVADAGRHVEAVSALVHLAELLAIPVIDTRNRMNFPTSHPLHFGPNPQPYIEKADVILVVDHDVPYVPTAVKLQPDVKIIQIDIDPIKQDIPLWGFPVDLPILADSSKAIPALYEAAQKLISAMDKERCNIRLKQLQAEHQAQRARLRESALSKAGQKPISGEWLAYCINEVMPENTVYVSEVVTDGTFVNQHIQVSQPGTFFRSGGSSLGWGLGAAVGAKLALPDKTVVCLSSDGCFTYSNPIACLWAADVYQAPFLTVIFNNQCYNATKAAMKQIYADGYSLRGDEIIGTDICPSPSYELIAKACRAYAETVEAPEEVKPALLRALGQVRRGRPAVLDVIIARP